MSEGHVERLALWRRQGKSLVPASADAVRALEKLREGERVWVTADRRRSVRQHRFFYALLGKVAEAKGETGDALLAWTKVRLGKFDVVRAPGVSRSAVVLHSMSFAAMKQEEFQKFMEDAVDVWFSEILPDAATQEMIAEINAMLGPDYATVDDNERDARN